MLTGISSFLDGKPNSAFPLGLCEGDCDSDSDVSWCQPVQVFELDVHTVLLLLDFSATMVSNATNVRDTNRFLGAGVVRMIHPSLTTVLKNLAPTQALLDHRHGQHLDHRDQSLTWNMLQMVCSGHRVWLRLLANCVSCQPYIYVLSDGKPYSAYPLGPCQGDCDDDNDCEYGTFCFQRSRYDDVPGCRGGSNDSSSYDYCAPLPMDQQPQPGTFRLKLYWEEGYFW